MDHHQNISSPTSFNSPVEQTESPAIREGTGNAKLQPTKDFAISPADVLSGRGKSQFHHAGNKRFRDAVSASLPAYMNAGSRYEKTLVTSTVIKDVRNSGGRFLKQNHITGEWRELNDQDARSKVAHAFRDAAASLEGRKKPDKKLKSEEAKKKAALKSPPPHQPAEDEPEGLEDEESEIGGEPEEEAKVQSAGRSPPTFTSAFASLPSPALQRQQQVVQPSSLPFAATAALALRQQQQQQQQASPSSLSNLQETLASLSALSSHQGPEAARSSLSLAAPAPTVSEVAAALALRQSQQQARSLLDLDRSATLSSLTALNTGLVDPTALAALWQSQLQSQQQARSLLGLDRSAALTSLASLSRGLVDPTTLPLSPAVSAAVAAATLSGSQQRLLDLPETQRVLGTSSTRDTPSYTIGTVIRGPPSFIYVGNGNWIQLPDNITS